MKRQIKNIVVAAATLAMTTANTLPAQACGGGGGISVRRSLASTFQSSFRQPAYRQSNFRQPVYSQPAYQQNIQSMTGNSLISTPPMMQQATTRSQQANQQSVPRQAMTVQSSSAQTANPVQSTRPAQQARATQQATNNVPVRSAKPVAQTEASALSMLASISTSPAGTPSSAASSQPKKNEATIEIPQFTAAKVAVKPAGDHVGTWKVSLPGNQSVQLVLGQDGSFIWTAAKSGKTNSFQGQYRLERGRLTLVRSNDLQQMTGSWTGQGTAFSFKLDGATNSGLAFQRV